MKYNYWFHESVTIDYEEAYQWYENKEEGLGERFILEVRKKIQAVASHPEFYSVKGNNNFREAKVENFPFLIKFKLYKSKQEIFISSIHHEKKHPKKKYRL